MKKGKLITALANGKVLVEASNDGSIELYEVIEDEKYRLEKKIK